MNDPLEELFKTSDDPIKWPDLYYLKEETELGFYALKKLSENQENALSGMKQDLEVRLSEDLMYQSLKTDEEREGYAYHILGGLEDLIFELAEQQRYSMCQSVFSFFEGRLRTLCEYIVEATSLKAPKKKPGQDDLSTFHDFLADGFKADLSQTLILIDSIKSNKRVRNAIAHKEGWTTDENLVRDAGQPNGLLLSLRGSKFKILVRDSKYTDFLLSKMQDYFALLFPAVGRRAQDLRIT